MKPNHLIYLIINHLVRVKPNNLILSAWARGIALVVGNRPTSTLAVHLALLHGTGVQHGDEGRCVLLAAPQPPARRRA